MRRKWLSTLTLFSLFVHAASAQPAVIEVVPSAVPPALDAAPTGAYRARLYSSLRDAAVEGALLVSCAACRYHSNG